MHDTLWLAYNRAMSAEHKQGIEDTSGVSLQCANNKVHPACSSCWPPGAAGEEYQTANPAQKIAQEVHERTLRHTNDAYSRSQLALKERIAQHRVRRQRDLRVRIRAPVEIIN